MTFSVLWFRIYPNVPLLNSVFFANAELNSSSRVLDLFLLAQYFYFKRIKRQREWLIEFFRSSASNWNCRGRRMIGIDKKVARLSDDCILNLNGEHVQFRMWSYPYGVALAYCILGELPWVSNGYPTWVGWRNRQGKNAKVNSQSTNPKCHNDGSTFFCQ